MQAQQVQTPSPEPGLPSGYTCSQSPYTKDGGSGLVPKISWGETEPAAGINKFKSKITWSIAGGEEFLQKVRNENDREMYSTYIQIREVIGGEIVETLNATNLFEPQSKTFYFKLQPGEEIKYSGEFVVCWQEGGAWQRDYNYRDSIIFQKQFIWTRPADGGIPTGENLDQEGTSRVVIPDQGDLCDCEFLSISKRIPCQIGCGIANAGARFFKWSWNVMRYYAGLDELQELPPMDTPTEES